jgi:ribulose-5-phosphate 4-epimerase/fuculose-1-phosphate aldolase
MPGFLIKFTKSEIMEKTLDKFTKKITKAGLGRNSGSSEPLIGGLDDCIVWNRKADETEILEKVFKGLYINSLACLRPAEPYGRILNFLANMALNSDGVISPEDCETRTFLHDLPVIRKFDPDSIIRVLKKRKSVIVADQNNGQGSEGSANSSPAIISHGAVSPEQAYVTISSVCFAAFVKFFSDYPEELQKGTASDTAHALFDALISDIQPVRQKTPKLMQGPFRTEESVYSAIIEAGVKTVEYGLVDSYFGNVSCLWNNILYISQTGSSLDELAGCIDPVPLNGSTSAGLTASSELSAHIEALSGTGATTMLHGHPKFSVIMSMDCEPKEKAACQFSDQFLNLCHIKCPKKRFVGDIPIVPGEVGTGLFGLCNTLPPALESSNRVIVYGHGIFAVGKHDFTDAFESLLRAEESCRNIYFDKVRALKNL